MTLSLATVAELARRTLKRVGSMRIQLIRKLAKSIDGVDLSGYEAGDVLDLSVRDAQLLIAEEWAVVAEGVHGREIRHHSAAVARSIAADAPMHRAAAKQLRRVSRQLETGEFEQHQGRRNEDRLLQELYDARGRIIRSDQD
jgi:hypothetical protein